jgi:hypothetical protein
MRPQVLVNIDRAIDAVVMKDSVMITGLDSRMLTICPSLILRLEFIAMLLIPGCTTLPLISLDH